MIVVRPMTARDEDRVRNLFTICHPTWTHRPVNYYTAFPTLVAVRVEDRQLVGFTSFFLTYPPPALVPDAVDKSFLMWGHDVCVDPHEQGHGIGAELFEARLTLARQIAVPFFIGTTWPSNKPMIRLFERHGCELRPERFENAYPSNPPDDQVGIMFTRGV